MMPRFARLLLFACVALPAPGVAQSAISDPSERGGVYDVRLHVGMWTTHLADLGRGLDANWLLAVGWRGVFGGTFVNSFGDRAFTVGIERAVARNEGGRIATGLGYRLGFVTGYDDRLMRLAAMTPVLPVLQIKGDLAVGRTGLELAWVGKVASVGPFMRVAS